MLHEIYTMVVVVVQLLSHVQLFVTPQSIAHQTSLPLTSSWSLPHLMSIESVMIPEFYNKELMI